MAAQDSASGERPRRERKENADRRRRQIVEATVRSVVRHGLAGTTLATVAHEAGLSQGVAVFYFKNKQALLAEVLRQQYTLYQECWECALAEAGTDPADQLLALVRADFRPEICNPESLIVWHAFWGEASARPAYAEISEAFDAARYAAIRTVCARLLTAIGRPADQASVLATAIDAMTDGLWLRLYLSTDPVDPAEAFATAARMLAAMLPERAQTFAAALPGRDARPARTG